MKEDNVIEGNPRWFQTPTGKWHRLHPMTHRYFCGTSTETWDGREPDVEGDPTAHKCRRCIRSIEVLRREGRIK